ncbi:glycosyltransferase [Parabacteroides sp.]
MKILQINCVYAIGSTGKIVEDISHFCTTNGDEVLILYGRQGKNIVHNVIKVSSEFEAKIHSVLSRMTGLDFSYSPLATKKAIKAIEEFKPEIVHLHCLNGHFINVYDLIKYLKSKDIPTILTLHAEIMHTAGCEHAFDCMKWIEECHNCEKIKGKLTCYFRDDAKYAYHKMQKSFDGFNNLTIVSVSDWLTNRAKLSTIFKHTNAKFITIENGLDLLSFHPVALLDNPLKNHIDHSKPIILYVTPNFLHPLKGGKYVIELARRNPKWNFIIVGYNGNGKLPENVIPISHIQSKEELSWYYNIASLTLLTSKRETFSMVCAESLACGTPIVGFEAGGPESVFVGNFVKFVKFGDVNALEKAVKGMLTQKVDIDSSLIHKRFTANRMAEAYRKLYKQIKK